MDDLVQPDINQRIPILTQYCSNKSNYHCRSLERVYLHAANKHRCSRHKLFNDVTTNHIRCMGIHDDRKICDHDDIEYHLVGLLDNHELYDVIDRALNQAHKFYDELCETSINDTKKRKQLNDTKKFASFNIFINNNTCTIILLIFG